MTQAEFLKKLAEKARRTKAKWEIRKGGAVRCANGLCPIEFVAGTERGSWYGPAVRKTGLTYGVTSAILDAADNVQPDKTLRSALLKAVGLAALTLSLTLAAPSSSFAHNNKEKPSEKPTQEKPAEKQTERPAPQAPGTADADRPNQTSPSGPTVRARVTVPVVLPAPFLPMVIRPHVTQNGPQIILQVERGTPKVSTFSTCKERGLPLTCRVVAKSVVTKPAVKTVVKPEPKIQLPYGK